ncbi:hypothetical protein BO82DRAFT_121638 [Aspergillus uvarum CBS 121591]|uniref:Uncharacterized protein n=1 Tax=Aspergillus uvarum CBS 121591 TaxID=1448315 RepID=A0A319C1N8_9EURO|nr:hypothetical protein BO82DRAFT_121638 [Aspergillus uvarum CBS 121591]PYH79936.1 hypothetical protein BO82DRAFT_121638 [Aspergillus uvarum CBS 121591]
MTSPFRVHLHRLICSITIVTKIFVYNAGMLVVDIVKRASSSQEFRDNAYAPKRRCGSAELALWNKASEVKICCTRLQLADSRPDHNSCTKAHCS